MFSSTCITADNLGGILGRVFALSVEVGGLIPDQVKTKTEKLTPVPSLASI